MIPLRGWVVVGIWALALTLLGSQVRAETGIASYYGGRHDGSPTASGERFNQNAPTCAHRTHKLGSVLRITTRGRSVECRVNDRGPFVRGRIVDLSVAGAKALGIISVGVAPVTVERVR